MANNTPNPIGSAAVSAQVGSAGPAISVARVNPNNELKITIVTDATKVNTNLNILIIPSLTPSKLIALLGAAVPDQDHIILTSSLSDSEGLAEFSDYINNAGLNVGYIRLVTTDTSLYNNNLYYGVLPFNGTTQPGYWPLSNYAQNGSNGFAKNLTIDTMPDGSPFYFPITKNSYLYFDVLPVSNTITMYLGITGTGEANLTA